MDVSIIVPFYEGNEYISRIIDMVNINAQSNTDIDVELILVNDSPWNDVCLPNDDFGFHISVLKGSKNVGIHGARVNGLKAASGKYVLMLDQDDIITDDFITKSHQLIGDADVCVSNGILHRQQGDKPIYLNLKKHKLINNLFSYVYLENRILSPGQCLMKKNSIPEEWINCTLDKNGADDLVLWILMLCQGRKFVVNNNYLYEHIDTGKNVSSDELNMAASTFEACDYLKNVSYVPHWIPIVLKRKTQNDVFYIETGKDKFIDYKMIEVARKRLGRSRN